MGPNELTSKRVACSQWDAETRKSNWTTGSDTGQKITFGHDILILCTVMGTKNVQASPQKKTN